MSGFAAGEAGSGRVPDLGDARFELVKVLGEGGMATVYRALDRHTNEWVAVKVLRSKYVEKSRIRKRFITEANAMMRLKHRNVCHVVFLNEKALAPYFAMELAEGGCVVEWLAEYGEMPPKMAVDIAIQVSKGLGAAHRQGVIHRDVKPHNILVNRRGVCKITDFGIAQLEDDSASLTRTGSVMGTLGYIAPEQRTNAKDVDERSDVYSVGATLYTMLTARTTMDLFFADQEPEMMEGVHEVLQPIVLKATRYRREERHQTMRELAKELYHAKALLDEPPADTPSLVMNNPAELTDELLRMTTSDVTSETPFSDLSVPGGMLPNASPGGLQNNGTEDTGPSTTPGIPRTQLLRPEEEKRPSKLLAAASMLAIGLTPLVLLLGTFGALAMSGRSSVNEHVGQVIAAHNELEATLETEAEVITELAGLGISRSELDSQWSSWQSSTGTNRQVRVEVMARVLRKVLEQNEPPAGSSRVHLARKASGRLDRIDAALVELDDASDALDDASRGFTARLAIAFGLASNDY